MKGLRGLKNARCAKGLTQKQLSKLLGISTTSISLMEHGKQDPTLKTLRAIADILQVSIDVLIGGDAA